MNTARLLVPIFTLRDFLYLLLDFLLAGFLIEILRLSIASVLGLR